MTEMPPEDQARYDQLEKGKQKAIEVREQAIELSKKLGFRTKGRKAQRETELWIATAEIEQRKLRE